MDQLVNALGPDAENGLGITAGDNGFREIPQRIVDGLDEIEDCRQHLVLPDPELFYPSDAVKRD
ncbi:hypothetical protein [Microbispora sp. NRRL B-24597]|nr:hypothetical protein [Microbispora sp. NRRL B-24597]